MRFRGVNIMIVTIVHKYGVESNDVFNLCTAHDPCIVPCYLPKPTNACVR